MAESRAALRLRHTVQAYGGCYVFAQNIQPHRQNPQHYSRMGLCVTKFKEPSARGQQTK